MAKKERRANDMVLIESPENLSMNSNGKMFCIKHMQYLFFVYKSEKPNRITLICADCENMTEAENKRSEEIAKSWKGHK